MLLEAIAVVAQHGRVLLTLTHRGADSDDLGHLLHKHPARHHEANLPFGKATVFYPKVEQGECSVALLVEVDPVDLVRGKNANQTGWALGQYVNDRPYAASSFLSVAISRVFGSAMNARCTKRPELVDTPRDLEAVLPVVPAPGEGEALRQLFEPLGYAVETRRLPLEPAFPGWGESRYHHLSIRATTPLHRMLKHLYLLIPALDRTKHYSGSATMRSTSSSRKARTGWRTIRSGIGSSEDISNTSTASPGRRWRS